MPGQAVVAGALLSCPAGTAPGSLKVTSQAIESINGMMVATVADGISETNIPSFGTCDILTAEAGGTSCPCVPATTGMWVGGSTVQTINGLPVLTSLATLPCSIGNTIVIDEPGQVLETTM